MPDLSYKAIRSRGFTVAYLYIGSASDKAFKRAKKLKTFLRFELHRVATRADVLTMNVPGVTAAGDLPATAKGIVVRDPFLTAAKAKDIEVLMRRIGG
jgi:hypothetical protein